jgi:predicted RND superfamily exporter protein
MGRQYTRKYKGGESQQEILGRLTEDAVKITKDIEALRDSLKLPEVSKKEDKVEEIVEEDDNKYEGLSDMFSIKDFVQKSEAAKKAKEVIDKLRTDYIQKIQTKITSNSKSKGNRKPSNDKYHNAIKDIENAESIDEIMKSFNKHEIRWGSHGQVKGGKTKKLQKKSKKTQRKSHRK